MPKTQVRSESIEDGGIHRADLNVSTPGQAVIRRLLQGSNIALTSTGADAGTGDVTVSLPSDISLNKVTATTVAFSKFEITPLTVAATNPMRLNAHSMLFTEYGDKIRFKAPISIEHKTNAVDWAAWSGTLAWGGWADLTDGRPSTGVGVPNSYLTNGGRLRFTYDIGDMWSDVSQWRIIQEYHQRPYWITVEHSSDLAAWTTLIDNRYCTDAMVQTHFHDGAYDTVWQRYVRITLQPDSGVTWYSNEWALNAIEAMTFRPGAQGGIGFDRLLPFTWTPTKDLQLPAKLIVENDAELRRWVYVRDTVNGVSGISLYAANWGHAGFITYGHGNKILQIGTTDTDSEIRIPRGLWLGDGSTMQGRVTFYPSNGTSWFHLHNSNTNELIVSNGATPAANIVARFTLTGIILPGSIQAEHKAPSGTSGFSASIAIWDENAKLTHNLVYESGLLIDYYTT